jgi:hypothetical protein
MCPGEIAPAQHGDLDLRQDMCGGPLGSASSVERFQGVVIDDAFSVAEGSVVPEAAGACLSSVEGIDSGDSMSRLDAATSAIAAQLPTTTPVVISATCVRVSGFLSSLMSPSEIVSVPTSRGRRNARRW